MLLLAETTSVTLFVMGALLIAFVLVRRSKKTGRLSKQPPLGRKEPAAPTPARHHLDAPGAMGRWEVEMHELARDLSGQLDSKIAIVQRLIVEAREAAARLEAIVARAEQAGIWQRVGKQIEKTPVDPARHEPAAAWPTGNSGSSQPRSIDEAAAAESVTPDLIAQTERIYHLADEGLSSAEIADDLGEPLGAIELILSVRPSQRA